MVSVSEELDSNFKPLPVVQTAVLDGVQPMGRHRLWEVSRPPLLRLLQGYLDPSYCERRLQERKTVTTHPEILRPLVRLVRKDTGST